MTEGPGSISSIVDSVFTEYLSKKLEEDDNETKEKKHKPKSHKEKHKKHKHKDKSKDEQEEDEKKLRKRKEKRYEKSQSTEPRNESDRNSRYNDVESERHRHSKGKHGDESYKKDYDKCSSKPDREQRASSTDIINFQNTFSDKSVDKNLRDPFSQSSKDQRDDSDSSGGARPLEDTGFFAKEGFLDPKSKKNKKHKKHKKEHKHKHKHKDKDRNETGNIEKLSFIDSLGEDSQGSSNGKLSLSGIESPKNEKADEFARDLREKLNSMKDNLSKKHKALEDIGKAQPIQTKKIKLCTEISLVEKYADKEVSNSKVNISPPNSSDPHAVCDKEAESKEMTNNKDTEQKRNIGETGRKIQIKLSSISLPAEKPQSNTEEKQVDEDGFKMMIPRSVKLAGSEDAMPEERDEDQVAKPVPQPVAPPAKKMMSLKISATSASLIQSGVKVVDPKKQSMEEGELSDSPGSTKSSLSDVSSGDLTPVSSEIEDEDTDGEIQDKKKRDKKKKKKDKKSKRSRSRSPKRSKKRSRSRSFDAERGIWKDGSMSRRRRSKSRSKDKRRRSRDKDRDYKSRKASRRSRDRDRKRSRSPHGYRDRGFYGYSRGRPFYARGYRRSRSRSRSRDRDRRRSKTPEDLRLKIDRVQLREIAMKNAYTCVHEGRSLATLQPDQIAALKAGGKSLEELTDFCKKITEKEALKAAGHISDEEDVVPDFSDEPAFINHPFAVREPTNMEITMRIRNAKQLPVSSFAERQQQSAELRVQFPVSSGTVHKNKEDEWVPVEKPDLVTAKPQGSADLDLGRYVC